MVWFYAATLLRVYLTLLLSVGYDVEFFLWFICSVAMIWSGNGNKSLVESLKDPIFIPSSSACCCLEFVTFFLFPSAKNEISYQLAIPDLKGAGIFDVFSILWLQVPFWRDDLSWISDVLWKKEKRSGDWMCSSAIILRFCTLILITVGFYSDFRIYGWRSHICSLVFRAAKVHLLKAIGLHI